MPKIVDIQDTPNPNAKKFVLKEPLTNAVARSYECAQDAHNDPLARALFAIPHVTNVFYQDRWLTITQDGGADWPALLRAVAKPVREAQAPSAEEIAAMARGAIPAVEASNIADALRLQQINALLDEQIRPALERDGGGLQVVGLVGNRLMVHYQGACGTCPSSFSGTLAAIEHSLHAVEPDLELVAV